MARPGPATQAKRQRELAKQEKQLVKQEKRAMRKAQKEANAEEPHDSDGDPDISGIVPGPQAPLY